MNTRYATYLASPRWRVTRIWALALAGYRCQECRSKVELQVHHLNYENLGNEGPADLVVLCKPCHTLRHFQTTEQMRLDAAWN